MLERIENVNEQVIEKMFLLYAESMADMEREFKDRDEMEASYAAFLKEFIENPKQMVFVETDTSCNGVFERHRRKKDRLHYRKK